MLSREQGKTQLTTNNATNPTMEHVPKSEGFEPNADGIGLVNDL